MFPKTYTSVNEFMEEQREQLKRELNSYTPYYNAVARLRFRMIGCTIEDYSKREICRWASHNDASGRILEIVPTFQDHEPDFLVRGKEQNLLRIINNFDELRAHPIRAVATNATTFSAGRMRDSRMLPLVIAAAITELGKGYR